MCTGRALVLLLTLLLAGCGFQLRSAPDWSAELDPVYIGGLELRDPLYLTLVRSLRGAGVEVLTTPTPQATVLRVSRLSEERRVLSVTGAARISEYELSRVLEAELRLPDRPETLALNRMEVSRVYVFDAAAVLAQSEREDELRQAMNRDLVRLLQLQVQAILDQPPAAPAP